MDLKKFLMASGLSMVLLLGACGDGEEEETSEEPATEEDSAASSGDVDAEGIAQSTCASCHGQDFSGSVGPALAGTALSEDEFNEIVRNGEGQMPAFSEDNISNEELSALYTYFGEQ